jgi:hypothetical protein
MSKIGAFEDRAISSQGVFQVTDRSLEALQFIPEFIHQR